MTMAASGVVLIFFIESRGGGGRNSFIAGTMFAVAACLRVFTLFSLSLSLSLSLCIDVHFYKAEEFEHEGLGICIYSESKRKRGDTECACVCIAYSALPLPHSPVDNAIVASTPQGSSTRGRKKVCSFCVLFTRDTPCAA